MSDHEFGDHFKAIVITIALVVGVLLIQVMAHDYGELVD